MKGKGVFILLTAVVVGLFFSCINQADAVGKELSSRELETLIKEKSGSFFLIDVRTEAEYASGHIPEAVNIPVAVIGNNVPTSDKNALIIVYCRSGNRSAAAREILVQKGYTNVIDFGGISKWRGELVVP